MSKGRFLNQKLGKRTTRKVALLKARILDPGFRIQATKGKRIQDSGFRIQGPKQKPAPAGTKDAGSGRESP